MFDLQERGVISKRVGVILIANRLAGAAKKERRLFVCDHASVGRADDCDLILPGEKTSSRHARFHWRDNELVVVDLASRGGVFVNGERQSAMKCVVRESDVVRIGDWEIRWVPDDLVIETDEEKAMFEAIAKDPASDDVRQVYGDWLEERGRTVEAELIAIERLSASLPAKEKKKLRDLEKKRRELARAPHLRASWRCVVTRPTIEGCFQKNKCPGSWDRLSPTPELRIRKCTSCSRQVYFMTDKDHAQRRVRRQCIVVDPGVE
jgi:uncharacterized protein (TIGR02996 family)